LRRRVSLRALLAVGVSLCVVGFGLVLALSHRAPRLAGSNDVRPAAFVVRIPPGRSLCQGAEQLPSGARSLRVVAASPAGALPAVDLTVADPRGRLLATGRTRGGLPSGSLAIPLSRRAAGSGAGASLCLLNRGPGFLAVAGVGSAPGLAARVAGRPASGRIAVTYMRGGRESWWDVSGAVTSRLERGRGGVLDGAAGWLSMVLIAATWTIALALVVLEARGPGTEARR